MRVAFFVSEFPSLSETFILSQIVGLIDGGHSVKIYARNAQKVLKVHPLVEQYNLLDVVYYHPFIPRNYFSRALKGFLLFCRAFVKVPTIALKTLNIKKYGKHASSLKLLYRTFPLLDHDAEYDILMCHFGEMGLQVLDIKEVSNLSGKLCVAFHGFDLSAYIQKHGEAIYQKLFQEADLMLPISDFWKKRLIELGCEPKKIKIHRMGIDVDRFTFQPRTIEDNEPIQLVSIARLVEKKGLEYGIRALQEVIPVHPSIKYTIVGSGPLMPQLAALVESLALEDIVELVGWRQQDEVIGLLDKAHIMLAPSVTSRSGDMEGIPVVIMEAMAMGIPVISTWHSGIPELIESGESGYLVPERDTLQLAKSTGMLIGHPEDWACIGKAGRTVVEENFNNARLVNQLIAIFESKVATSS